MANPVPEQEERIDPFEIFPAQIRDNVRGLSYIGYLEKPISFCGHSFTIRNLRPAEKAAIGIVVQPWRGTLSEAEVWQNCHVAIALTEVDGSDDFCPQAGGDLTAHVRARLNYITNPDNGWFQPTLDFLYLSLTSIELEVAQAIQELQNLAERSQQPSPPSADSLTAPGASPELIEMATRLSDPSS